MLQFGARVMNMAPIMIMTRVMHMATARAIEPRLGLYSGQRVRVRVRVRIRIRVRSQGYGYTPRVSTSYPELG